MKVFTQDDAVRLCREWAQDWATVAEGRPEMASTAESIAKTSAQLESAILHDLPGLTAAGKRQFFETAIEWVSDLWMTAQYIGWDWAEETKKDRALMVAYLTDLADGVEPTIVYDVKPGQRLMVG